MSNKSKASICFLVPIDSTDAKTVKAAFTELRKQVCEFAEAVALNPNIMITHAVVSEDPTDMRPIALDPASSKIASLQTIGKKIDSGKSSVTNPKQPTIPLGADDDDEHFYEEKPRVVAGEYTPPAKVDKTTRVIPADPPIEIQGEPTVKATSDDDALAAAIFKKMRKTDNTVALVDFFIKKKDTDVTLDDISKATKLGKQDVSVWFNNTGSKIKAIGKTGRGVYRFTSSKVKV